MRKLTATVLTVAAAVSLAACGGSSSSSSASATTSSAPATTSSTPATTSATSATTSSASSPSGSAPTTAGGPVTIATGPVHATLRGENHAPKAGKPWHYVLKVTDASGQPLAGTVDVEFALGPAVVGHDTPPVHALKNGRLTEVLTFPSAAIGHAISLQTVVHTKDGSVTLDWPVMATQ